MASGGGGGSQVDRAAQQQQLDIERRRLALEEESAAARLEERGLLEQQLADQQAINERQFSLLRELNEQSLQSEAQITSLLEESTALARRATTQQQSEAERARAAEEQQRNRALSLINSNAVRTNVGRPRQSAVFNPNERLSILSSIDLN